ncbi:MAG: acyl-CoA desaturase [Candidatus Pacebacteria bacterium]|nr:acyl-CoA desaturase [Candidatus Paceibacterota bacterium]
MIALYFLLAHWFLSLFCQTFFLHRYASHKMFTMKRGTERFFYFLTFLFQGSSFLNPRAYALMHRMHHEYSDTEKDPHPPHLVKDIWRLMLRTRDIYSDFVSRRVLPENQFDGDYPEWPALDSFGNRWSVRIGFGVLYIVLYCFFVEEWWLFFLLPIHFLMGPIHGAIVNWCGHKYGYANYNNEDKSKNTFPIELFLMGELFQNNHHKFPKKGNFAVRWFEFDPTWPIIKLLDWCGVIRLKT